MGEHPTSNPTVLPTNIPSLNPTISQKNESKNSTMMNDGLFEKEEKRGNYSVLIILIIIFLTMLIAVIIIQIKKSKMEKEMKDKGDKIEMRNKNSSESNVHNANDGLLDNDVVAQNKEIEDDMMIIPMAVAQIGDDHIDDDEYELTSTDNEDD